MKSLLAAAYFGFLLGLVEGFGVEGLVGLALKTFCMGVILGCAINWAFEHGKGRRPKRLRNGRFSQ